MKTTKTELQLSAAALSRSARGFDCGEIQFAAFLRGGPPGYLTGGAEVGGSQVLPSGGFPRGLEVSFGRSLPPLNSRNQLGLRFKYFLLFVFFSVCLSKTRLGWVLEEPKGEEYTYLYVVLASSFVCFATVVFISSGLRSQRARWYG